jgi:hypothetical protein
MFMTWFGRGKSDRSAMKKVNASLNIISAELQDDYISCYGENMIFIRRGHPDREDYEKILNWVQNL